MPQLPFAHLPQPGAHAVQRAPHPQREGPPRDGAGALIRIILGGREERSGGGEGGRRICFIPKGGLPSTARRRLLAGSPKSEPCDHRVRSRRGVSRTTRALLAPGLIFGQGQRDERYSLPRARCRGASGGRPGAPIRLATSPAAPMKAPPGGRHFRDSGRIAPNLRRRRTTVPSRPTMRRRGGRGRTRPPCLLRTKGASTPLAPPPLVHLSPHPPPSTGQRRRRAGRCDEAPSGSTPILGRTIPEEGVREGGGGGG